MPAKVGRIAQTHVVSRPYAAAKDIQGRKVTCESCDRTMTSKDWPSHERSKKHVELKEKAIRAEQEAKITEQRIDDWVGDQDDSGASENRADQATDNGGWDADATATGDNTNGKWAGGTANAGGWGGGNGGAHGGNGWGDSGNNGGDGYTTQPRRGGRFGGGNGGGSGGRDGGGDNNCFKCGQPGHFSRECTQAETCFNCGAEGHRSRQCPGPKKSGGGRACYKCNEEGHIARECPNDNGGSGSGGGDRACYNCGLTGHMSRDCTEPRKPREGGGGGGRSCYNCGNGHMSRDCPEPQKPRERDPRGSKCFDCQEYGHKKEACPNDGADGGSYGNGGYDDGGFGDNSGGFDEPAATSGGWADDAEGEAIAPAGGDNW